VAWPGVFVAVAAAPIDPTGGAVADVDVSAVNTPLPWAIASMFIDIIGTPRFTKTLWRAPCAASCRNCWAPVGSDAWAAVAEAANVAAVGVACKCFLSCLRRSSSCNND
jgi:hypothetical protein